MATTSAAGDIRGVAVDAPNKGGRASTDQQEAPEDVPTVKPQRLSIQFRLLIAGLLLALVLGPGLLLAPEAKTAATAVYQVDHVVDGDTVDLTNGAKVRLVQ